MHITNNMRHQFYMFEVILKNKMAARTEFKNFADSAFSNDGTHFKRKPLEVLSSQNFVYGYIMPQGRLLLNFAQIRKTRWPPQPILCIFFFAQLRHGELTPQPAQLSRTTNHHLFHDCRSPLLIYPFRGTPL